MKPLLVSIPHSGEQVPQGASWLHGLPEPILMCDVDRYVDQLYVENLSRLKIPHVVTPWHRYVVDLNRLPEDVDQDSVIGSKNPSGQFTTGLHWVKTTKSDVLMPKPITQELHENLVQNYYEPFHAQVRKLYEDFRKAGHEKIYHMDLHSMPSMGTKAHRDPGERRKAIVVSDFNGKSCEPWFKDLVIQAFTDAGFEVGYNWPYIGGRVTQIYGQPHLGQHAIQVELNRAYYMDEETKKIKAELVADLTGRLGQAITDIYTELQKS